MGEPVQPHSAYVIIHGPGHNGTGLVLREGITSFGRLPSNDVILLGDLVSRHHTRITFFEGRATLQDLGSHNGSWVNGERVNTRVLKQGDACRVGNFRLAFHVGPMPEQRPGTFEDTTAAEEARRSSPRLPVASPTPLASVARGATSDPGSRSAILHQLELARSGHDHQAKALHLLVRSTDALSKSATPEHYLSAMLQLVVEQAGAEQAAYLEGGPGSLAVVAARSPQGSLTTPKVASSVVGWVVTKNFEVQSDDVSNDLRFPQAGRQAGSQVAVICAPVPSGDRALGALYVSRVQPFAEDDLDAVTAIAHLTGAGLARSRAVAGQSGYAALLAPELRALAEAGPPTPALEGTTTTVVCLDLPGLSQAAERVDLDLMEAAINALMRATAEAAQRHRGWLVPTGGTELRLLFRAGPTPTQDAAHAIAAALEIRSATDPVLQRLPSGVPKRIRVGIASGWLLTGIAGEGDRLSYVVMGDTLASAQTLQSMAPPGGILLAEETYRQVQETFEARRFQTGPGDSPFTVFELTAKRGPAGRPRAG